MENIIISIISLLGTLGGSLGGILVSSKLTNYRIEQLEKKVDKHNNFAERMPIVEAEVDELKAENQALKQTIKKLHNDKAVM